MNSLISKSAKFIKAHSNEILSGLELIGLASTAYFSAQGGKKEVKAETRAEKVKGYIPAITSGAITAGCIVANGYWNHKKGVALAAACLALNESLKKASNQKGSEIDEKETKTVEENKVETTEEEPRGVKDSLLTKGDDQLSVYDQYTRSWYSCSRNDILYALLQVNNRLHTFGYCSAKYFYDQLGVKSPAWTEYTGWSLDCGDAYGYDYIDGEVIKNEYLKGDPLQYSLNGEFLKIYEDEEYECPEHYQWNFIVDPTADYLQW